MIATKPPVVRATYSFTLVFAGEFDDLSREFLDAVYEAGCDDAHVTIRRKDLRIGFDREAPSFRIALFSAIADLDRAGLGLELAGVETE